VRAIQSVLVIAFLCSACEEREPVTDPRDLGRLGEADDEAQWDREEPAEGIAEAQPPQRRMPPQQPQQQPAQPGSDPRAPDRYTVRMETTEGPIVIDVTRAWAPNGADRFHALVREGYFTDIAFFRVLSGFMAQAGIHGDPAVAARWRDRRIQDDPVREHNTRGMVSYAMAGPNTRTTQFFINFGDNQNLDGMGFAPFGRVRDMAAVDRLYAEYGEGAPRGRGPAQGRLQSEGNAYLRAEFPELDYIRSATIE
jgi:peptidyl-prolyl cis-trans isomerase A (cyclophilin A)